MTPYNGRVHLALFSCHIPSSTQWPERHFGTSVQFCRN